ncbi:MULTISPECIES: hypothetical protein [unclassified Streptomyces]|uniref:hypothetical protein n=1 Tax=unclassified Streptomyces TaxID=2593676 RepID=UPI000DB9D1B4|nr:MULTISPECIES: hypothetical protein [unclassified Streptomyces]MYT72673.1 hypothetical protein [Streptomyces sp. SID8367]RAJ79530.1 hypothetical protein K377_05251 [Streptomyces sp. PsTaAH-137]
MRTRIRLTPDEGGGTFVARLAPSQASALRESLVLLRTREFGDAVLMLQVGADRATVDALVDRLADDGGRSRDIPFSAPELHTLHSALTSVATMFLAHGRHFCQEPFHQRIGCYREDADALALGIVDALIEARGGSATPEPRS